MIWFCWHQIRRRCLACLFFDLSAGHGCIVLFDLSAGQLVTPSALGRRLVRLDEIRDAVGTLSALAPLRRRHWQHWHLVTGPPVVSTGSPSARDPLGAVCNRSAVCFPVGIDPPGPFWTKNRCSLIRVYVTIRRSARAPKNEKIGATYMCADGDAMAEPERSEKVGAVSARISSECRSGRWTENLNRLKAETALAPSDGVFWSVLKCG